LVLGGNGVEDEGQTQKLAMSRADLVAEGVRLSAARVNNMTNAALIFTVRNRGTAAAPSSAAAAKRVTLRFPISIAPGPYFVIEIMAKK
jgi:hypothetical protein